MNTIAVIPALNEEERIAQVVADVIKYVPKVIVVDDGSNDKTASVARKAGAYVISHVENCGAGAATMTGIELARKMNAEAIVTLDADGQHNPDDIPSLLSAIENNSADIVYANRFGQRNRIPFVRRLFNGVGNIITCAVTGKWVPDSQCGFKAFGPRALREVDLKMSGFEFCTEIVRETAQKHWRMHTTPTKVLYSEYTLAKGQSFANGVKTALKILVRSFLR
ncbi:glycosyltransferase family 2 protein [Patescibacteria group bacterium]|nr:glycosyltransferase family 2 protein [Patescibacteria group bacterium]MBU1123901.1 glycosyltransferase family 2 protein [Patescibacteria group bacterium]MBU1911480.1 glycosyltransferase family 2 protein [Patescibacteria group bacterium]